MRRTLGACFNNLGDFELAGGQSALALASYAKAEELLESLVKAQPLVADYEGGLAFSLAGLGRAHARLGRFQEAAAELRRSSAIWHRLPLSTQESRYACAGIMPSWQGLKALKDQWSQQARRGPRRSEQSLKSGNPSPPVLARSTNCADVDFKALNGQAEFEALLMDLAFPAHPFTRGD